MATPVEAIIGLGLEVKGRAWDDLHARLDKHKTDWRSVEGSVERIGNHVETLSTRLLALGGAVGVGALIADFVRLEDQANRTALAIGNVTGGSDGFLPIGQQLLGASKATGFAAPTLGQAIEQLQQRAGGTYLGHPGAVPAIARALGVYAGAYSINPQTLAQQLGTLELFQRQNPGSTPQLLQELAAQAARSGMAGQTGLFTQTVSGSVAALIGAHPASAGPGANIRLGAMYGAAQSVNPAFRDPGVFGQAIQGVDQAVTNAYTNPRLQAAMQMAGIGYWDQRGGLAGPNGPAIARKLLAWSSAQYGDGTIAQDMFLRSNFGGNVSADFLKALAAGRRKQDELTHAGRSPQALRDAQSAAEQRSRQYQHTPGAAAQRGRSGIEQELYDLFGSAGLDALNWVTNHPFESIAGAYAGKKLLGFGGRALGRSLSGRFAGREAQAAAEVAAEMAGNDIRAGRFGLRWGANLFDIPLFGGRGAAGAARAAEAARAARGGATGLEGLAHMADGHVPDLFRGFAAGGDVSAAARVARGAGWASRASRFLPYAGPAGDIAAFFLDDGSGLDSLPGIGGINAWIDPMGHGGLTDTTAQDSRHGQRDSLRRNRARTLGSIIAQVQHKYGPTWWMNPRAIAAAYQAIDRHYADPHQRLIARKQLRDALAQQAHHVAQVGREGRSGSAIHDLLGLIPGVGASLGGLFGMGAHALEQHGIDGGSGMLGLLGRALGKGSHPLHGAPRPPATASTRQFDKAVDRFSKSVDKLTLIVGGGFGVGGAAFRGGPAGAGMLNAGGLSGGSDLIGSSMILARAISASGGGGGGAGGGGGGGIAGMQYAGLGVQSTPGGGGGGGGGAGGGGGGSHGGSAHGGPANFRAVCNAAGSKYGVHPGILMAIAEIETGFWTNRHTSSAGALGPMQFMPGTWGQYGHGSIYSIHDSVFAAARYLVALGIHHDVRKAIFGYNHSWAYVDDVLRRARKYGYNPGHGTGTRTAKTGAGGGAGVQAARVAPGGGGSDPMQAALAWQAGGAGGGGGGGPGGAGGSGGGTHVTVNVDGRKIEHFRQLTRGRV